MRISGGQKSHCSCITGFQIIVDAGCCLCLMGFMVYPASLGQKCMFYNDILKGSSRLIVVKTNSHV